VATRQDIGPIYRGEDITLNFTMSPLTDITGWTMSFRLAQGTTTMLTVSATITTAAAGTFAVALTAAQTSTLSASSQYTYDVWRTDSGSAAALSVGMVTVLGSVRVP
jgi:hypothetical protein